MDGQTDGCKPCRFRHKDHEEPWETPPEENQDRPSDEQAGGPGELPEPSRGLGDTEEGRESSSVTEPWLSLFQASVSSLCKTCSLILQIGLGPETLLRIRLRKKMSL